MTRRPLIAALFLLLACGGDSSTTPTGPTPGFTFSLSPSTLTIVIGESGDYTVTVARTDGFTGPVSVAIDNPPSGVSVTPTTIEAGSTTGTLTLTTISGSSPGVFVLTVRASGPGVATKSTDANLVTRIIP